MANVPPKEKQVAVISALAEGSGIRQIERMPGHAGIDRDFWTVADLVEAA